MQGVRAQSVQDLPLCRCRASLRKGMTQTPAVWDMLHFDLIIKLLFCIAGAASLTALWCRRQQWTDWTFNLTALIAARAAQLTTSDCCMMGFSSALDFVPRLLTELSEQASSITVLVCVDVLVLLLVITIHNLLISICSRLHQYAVCHVLSPVMHVIQSCLAFPQHSVQIIIRLPRSDSVANQLHKRHELFSDDLLWYTHIPVHTSAALQHTACRHQWWAHRSSSFIRWACHCMSAHPLHHKDMPVIINTFVLFRYSVHWVGYTNNTVTDTGLT